MIVELAFDEPVVATAEFLQVLAYAVLAHVDAFVRVFHGSIRREQVCHLVPLALVEVEAIGALETFDVVRILHAIGARFER